MRGAAELEPPTRKAEHHFGKHAKSPQNGFTIIELLTAIGIIGLLLAITVPAVQWSRESARRAQCTNHLAQFGKALHAYESTYGAFPASAYNLNDERASRLHGGDRSAHFWLLPYLGRKDLFDLDEPGRKNGGSGWSGGGAKFAGNHRVPEFLCPSDGGGDPAWPGNNYRVCTGSYRTDFVRGRGYPLGGVFQTHRGTRAGEILDGLSSTIGASEKLMGSGQSFDPRRDAWLSGFRHVVGDVLDRPTSDETLAYCQAAPDDPVAYIETAGATWFVGNYDHSTYNHIAPPNAEIVDCDEKSSSPANPYSYFGRAWSGSYRASSNHAHGVNSLLMDGAVRFLSDNIDLATWRALGTMADGDVAQGAW